MLLAVYGVYGVIQSVAPPLAWTALFPPALLAAAVGVAINTRWARSLVYALTLVFVTTWGYSIWVAANAGYFQSSGPARSLLSLMPGIAFVLLGLFCCYVVTTTPSVANPSGRGPLPRFGATPNRAAAPKFGQRPSVLDIVYRHISLTSGCYQLHTRVTGVSSSAGTVRTIERRRR